MPWRARTIVKLHRARRAGRPQLKRDPLGSRAHNTFAMLPLTSVSLPQALAPKFPTRCVVCGTPNPPTTTFTTRDATKGKAFWAGWYSVEIPACRTCALRIRIGRIGSNVVTAVLLAITVSCYLLLPKWMPNWGAILTGLMVLLGGTIAHAKWSVNHPQPFEVDPSDDLVVFRFRDASIASEVASLNGASPAPAMGSAEPKERSKGPAA